MKNERPIKVGDLVTYHTVRAGQIRARVVNHTYGAVYRRSGGYVMLEVTSLRNPIYPRGHRFSISPRRVNFVKEGAKK